MPITRTRAQDTPAASPRVGPPADALDGGALADPLQGPPAAEATPPAAEAAPPERAPAASGPPAGADEPLPMVQLPSRFKPAAFLQASNARGVRPRALKAIDDQLSAVDAASDPVARFEQLTTLQGIVDDYVFRYGKGNPRGDAAFALKQWVDGAVALRADRFRNAKPTK